MSTDLRNQRLNALDACSHELLAGPLAGLNGSCARRELESVAALGEAVVRSLRAWRDLFRELEFSALGPFSVPAAARLVSEAVFDELLEPEASRLLGAAMDLAL